MQRNFLRPISGSPSLHDARMTEPPSIASYREFWPFYLREHSKPETRLWHIIGTGAASILLVAALLSFSYQLFLGALIAGYGPAWFAHFLVEKNRPATFRHPIWSLVSDYRMAGAWLTGSLGHELERAGVAHTEPPLN
jgi:hypothetical protein